MKKLFLTTILAALALTNIQAQLLYRISGKGLTKPSYIIGTHHLAKVAFIDDIKGAKTALTDAEQVYGELAWDDITSATGMQKMQAAMMLPQGQTLKTILTTEQYQKLDQYLIKTMSVGLSHPQVGAQMLGLKPAALTTQLTLLTYLQHHMGEFDPNNTFDQYFQMTAKKNNEFCGGLETLDEQMKVLFDKPMNRQVDELMCLIDNSDYYAMNMEELTKAFYAQDLGKLQQVSDEKIGGSCDPTAAEEAALIYDRNAAWVKKMPAIMAEKSTFFAVGALHLPGDKGVLHLLKKAGYTVEPYTGNEAPIVAAAGPVANNQNVKAAKKRVEEIYADVFGVYNKVNETQDMNLFSSRSFEQDYCSQAWNNTVAAVLAKDENFFDADYWVMGQDWDNVGIKDVKVSKVSDTVRTATLNLINFGASHPVSLTLVYERGNWFIDNFVDGQGGLNWKENMLNELK